MTEDDVATMKKTISTIRQVSPEFAAGDVPLRSHRNNMIARVAGVWPEFADMRNLIPQEGGRFLNDVDGSEKRRVIFIGNDLADKLFPGESAIGQLLQVRGVPFVVVGVMTKKDQNSSYNGRDSRQAFIPASTFHSMFSRRYPSDMVAQAYSMDAMPQMKKEIYRYMAARYNFDPDDTEGLSIWDTTEGFKFFNTFFMAFRMFLVGIGCLTLITGGIGVTNIMNVVLEERTKEIGIKMALGAKKSIIMTQFLFETVLLTAIGGAFGFGLALAIVKIFPMFHLTQYLGDPVIHMSGTLGAIGILGIIALAAGFFPARRAASLEPVKALKLF
jgi:putative ABC transport system permease protein